MTSFPASSATESSVPVATASGGDAQTIATLQAMLAAMANLQGAQHQPSTSAAPIVAAAPQPPAPITAPASPPPAPAPDAGPALPVFHTQGPWLAGRLYVVVPTAPLMAIVDAGSEALWYCITKGRYVGVTLNNSLAVNAVTGVSACAMKSYKTQALAVAAFNELLGFRMVAVVA